MKHLVRRSDFRYRLTTKDPELVLEHDRVMQGARTPRNLMSDQGPILAVGGVPHVEVVMALIHVAADDPEFVLENRIARGVAAFPVLRRVERAVEEGVRL